MDEHNNTQSKSLPNPKKRGARTSHVSNASTLISVILAATASPIELDFKKIFSKITNAAATKMTGKFSNSFDYRNHFKTDLTFSKILMNSLYNFEVI